MSTYQIQRLTCPLFSSLCFFLCCINICFNIAVGLEGSSCIEGHTFSFGQNAMGGREDRIRQ